MTISIPPIDVIELLQRNVIQSLLMVLLSTMIMFSQKSLLNRTVAFFVSLWPAYFLAGLGIELFLTSNWRMALGALLVSVGTWVWTKGEIKR